MAKRSRLGHSPAPYTKYSKQPHTYSPKLQQMLNAQNPREYRRLFDEHSLMILGYIPKVDHRHDDDDRSVIRRHR